MKKIKEIHKLLKDSNYVKKINIYFATKSVPDDYDPYEQNYEFSNLNPVTIKGIVRMISPEALVWKQYGLTEIGAVEILTEKKYKTWIQNANTIEIDGDNYSLYKEASGGRAVIQDRGNDVIRVVLQKR